MPLSGGWGLRGVGLAEMRDVRKAAVAGSWYPGDPVKLAAAVDAHLASADRDAADVRGQLTALVSPHAGLLFSGPVAAHAYRLLRDRAFDVAVLVGPSHFVGFEGVSLYGGDAFETPFGPVAIDTACARAIADATPLVREHAPAHTREHSLEMQLPFFARLAPSTPIVPLLMGYQRAATATGLGAALASALRGRNALLIASTDLSHYHDADTALAMDRVVIDHVSRFDADGLQAALDDEPHHACGGGPTVAVMRAAQALGARDARILHYADSGDVSGDKSAVVGYLAAALGTFT
jgi:AmmeMemoRadiSam system protein B